MLGLLRLAEYRGNGDGAEREKHTLLERAIALATPLAEKGDPDGLFVLGTITVHFDEYRGPVRPDFRGALRQLERAAEAGHTEAVSALGRFLVGGHPERLRSPREGARWLEQAVAREEPRACFALAKLHKEGNREARVEKNPYRAKQLFECAAAQGQAEAAHELAESSRNDVERRRWLERASALGHSYARDKLTHLQINGYGGPRDEAAALANLREIMAGRPDGADLAWIAHAIARQRDSSREALDLARAAVEQAMKIRDPHLWVDKLALVHLRLGDAPRAEALLRAELARRGDPTDIDTIRYRTVLGETLVVLGRPQEARAQWERALGPAGDSITGMELRYRLSTLERK